jgi:hypothetical protein
MNHYEIVKLLVDRNVVDFKKIGEFISEHGSSLAFDDGPEVCGTGPHYIHFYKLPTLGGYPGSQPGLEGLARIGSEIS